MAVSYLTNKVVESSPYIAPVSLDILAKVGTFKQSQYNQSHQNIQSQLDNVVAKTQGMNDVQRDYVNTKLTKIVNGLNTLGGADLSDMNISNQIDGFANSIYSDSNVLKFISNASSVNSYFASKQKMLSDPKMVKLYSEANAWDVEKEIARYNNSTDINENFNIQSSIKPFKNVSEQLDKIKRDIKANLVEVEGVRGVYMVKNSTETLTDDQIETAAYSRLDADHLAQVKRDANFTYEKLYKSDPNSLIKAAVNNDLFKIKRKKEELSKIYAMSMADPSNSFYSSKKSSLLKEIEDDEKNLSLMGRVYENQYSKDREQLQFDTYLKSLVNGKISELAYTKYSSTKKIDPFVPIENARQIAAQKSADYRERTATMKSIAEMKNKKENPTTSPNAFIDNKAGGNQEINEEVREQEVWGEMATLGNEFKERVNSYFIDKLKFDKDFKLSGQDLDSLKSYLNESLQDFDGDGKITMSDLGRISLANDPKTKLTFVTGVDSKNNIITSKESSATNRFKVLDKTNSNNKSIKNFIDETFTNLFNLYKSSSSDDFNYEEYKGIKSPELLSLLDHASKINRRYEALKSQVGYRNKEEKDKDIERIESSIPYVPSGFGTGAAAGLVSGLLRKNRGTKEMLRKNSFYGVQYPEAYFDESKTEQLEKSGVTNKILSLIPTLKNAKDFKITSIQRNSMSKDNPWKITYQYTDSKNIVQRDASVNRVQVSNDIAESIIQKTHYEHDYLDDDIMAGNTRDVDILSPTYFTYNLTIGTDASSRFVVRYNKKDNTYKDFKIPSATSPSQAIEAVKQLLNSNIEKFNVRSRKQLEEFLTNSNL